MRFLYLVVIFLVGVTVLTFMARQLEDPGTSSPEPLFGPAHDKNTSPQRLLQVHTAREKDTTNVKDMFQEERGDISLWNELLHRFAWTRDDSDKAFGFLLDAQRNENPKESKKIYDWVRRLVKVRAKGKKFDDGRYYRLLTRLDIPKTKLVPLIAQLRSVHGLTEVVDTMLGKLASEVGMMEQVFGAWLQCKAHPASIFNSFANKLNVHDQKFMRWLDYIDSYRKLKETNFRDEELFHLLTDDKLNSYDVMVETFNALLHQGRPASNTVAYNMMIYMTANSATSKLVLKSLLASKTTPRGVFEFLHLDKPKFDIKLFKPWVKYVEMYQGDAGSTSASTFSNQDFDSLLERITKSNLKQELTSFQEQLPEMSHAAVALLSAQFVESLEANKRPGQYFSSLRPAIRIHADNDLFRQWLRYVIAYMGLEQKTNDREQYTKKELVDFLLSFAPAPYLVKVFNGFQKTRIIYFADEILLTLATQPEAKSSVYGAWLGSAKHPKDIFERVLMREVGVTEEFENWLEYIKLYWQKRGTSTFSENDLFNLLTDGKVSSYQAVVDTFELPSRNDKSTTKPVAEAMIAFMAVNADTTKLVFQKWLKNDVHPKDVFTFRRLGKPEFDSDFVTQWLNYVKIFQAASKRTGIFHFDDYECVSLLRSKKTAPDLVPMLKSLQEDPALKELAKVALVDLDLSKSMDIWLDGRIDPRKVWTMLPPEVQINSNNYIFRRWMLYVEEYLKKDKSVGDEKVFTTTDLFYFVKHEEKTVAEVVTLFKSLKQVMSTKEISETMLKHMTTDPDLSFKVFRVWEQQSGDDPYDYFKIFPLQEQTPETTFVAWLVYLEKRTEIMDIDKTFDALCEATSDSKHSSTSTKLVKAKLQSARGFADAKEFAESLLKTQGPLLPAA